MSRSRTLSLLLAVALGMTLASSPAMAGKKKGKGEDLTHGHLYEPVTPIAHRRPVLENLETEVISPKAGQIQEAKQSEPGPMVFPVNGIGTLVLHKLFE
ncbi:MAG TPA: hypothetical protein VM661_06710 [Candidatus Sulfotelmatobacter sp.]|jgi:hypothetical protein|nr:hypothetical protein [Candidatus Sulfotelmatobacter sp.]